MRKPSALVYSVLKKSRKQRIEMPPSIHTPYTPWARRRRFLIAAGLLTLLVLGYLWMAWFLPERTVFGCSHGERAVLEEFPHYGDQQQVRTHSAEVSCVASYTLRVTRSEVLSYYDERLRENGWEVGGYWAANPPQGIEVFGEKLSDLEETPEEGVRSGLEARRDDYSYAVEYYPPGSPASSAEAGGSEDEAMIVVSVTDALGAGSKVK
jgi:hypothetical protein